MKMYIQCHLVTKVVIINFTHTNKSGMAE